MYYTDKIKYPKTVKIDYIKRIKLQNQNKSLTRGLQVLKEILFSDTPMTAITLCQKLDIDKSTMSRLVTSLMNEGFIKYLGNTKEIVKADILDIMTSKATREILIERTQDLLEDLFSQTNESSYLAVNENNSLLYLNQVDNSTRVIKMRNSVGLHAPLHCTALGKIILAYDDIDVKSLDYTEYTHNTVKKPRYLQKELDTIKQRGFAIENEEYEYGLSSVAVPIFGKENDFLGAIGISGLTARLNKENLNVFGESISKLAAKKILI